MKHNGLMMGAAVAALLATGDPAYAGSLPAQVDAAREAADADGDGSLDADERARNRSWKTARSSASRLPSPSASAASRAASTCAGSDPA